MSSSENLFAAHNSSSYSQQNHNGDISTTNRPGRANIDSITSVHDNPFYKNFGIRHSPSSYPRQGNRSLPLEQATKQVSSNGRSSSVDDDIGEYRPGSGYVHKLLDKFSSLTAREEQSMTIFHLKRSSSLDELPIENEDAIDTPIIPRGIGYEKPSYLSAAKLSHRARSIENLNHSHSKSHHSLAVSLRHVETKWEKDRQPVTPKFQRDSHIAPDVDLAREDIIIIENTASVLPLKENESVDEAQKVVSSHEVILQNEMPKPNTVFTVRSIFESASSGSGLYTRRQKSDSPVSPTSLPFKQPLSPLQTGHVAVSSLDNVSNRANLHSPSPVPSPRLISDTHVKPVVLTSNSTLTKADNLRHASDSNSYSRSDVLKSPVSNSSHSFITPQQPDHFDSKQYFPSDFSGVPSTEDKFRKQNSFEDTGSSNSFQFTTPSHSITSKSGVTSMKDRLEDRTHDELPVMIFTKSNISPKRSKSQRTKDYTPLIDEEKEIKKEDFKEVADTKNLREAKKIFEVDDFTKSAHETGAKTLSQRKFVDSNAKTADKNSSDQSKITYTKHHTTIEVKSSQKIATDREHGEEKSKHADSAAKSKLTKPVAYRRTTIAKSRTIAPEPLVMDDSESKDKQVTSSSTSRPVSAKSDPTSKLPDSISSEEIVPDKHKEKTSMSKRSYPNNSIALNEQPLSKVSKDKQDSKEEPVKGIPSIITQRLMKQSSDPSQVAENVFSSSEGTGNSFSDTIIDDGSGDTNLFSRKNLTPTSAKWSSSDIEKETLGSEIESEIAAVRKKMEGGRSKSAAPAPIFDSSQLSKKRKEKKNQQSSSASQGLVPQLDLSGITDDQIMEYQPQQRRVPPCNIVFLGENAKTSRSLLIKQRKIKINIHFSDTKTESFEYPSEETALERYLEEHPQERDEILVLEDFSGRGDESSDDVDIDIFETPVTPRGNTEDDLLKANTGLAHTGSLQSYRGRFQEDYELGTIILEKPNKQADPEPTVDPDKLMLRPAEEEDTNTWSTSSSSDILF